MIQWHNYVYYDITDVRIQLMSSSIIFLLIHILYSNKSVGEAGAGLPDVYAYRLHIFDSIRHFVG